MTYTVKNGTWCKDNEKEYYSTTKTGLKAALKAGEIPAGTKVVVHDPKYHAGQLIQSMNPNCPEGCFVPDGSAFDTSIYTELAAVFPDGNLPDLRECVLVMAGQNEHITTHNHDVFSAGEFKDDQAQLVEHNHAITDPGHDHGRGSFEITGRVEVISEPFNDLGVASGAFEKEKGFNKDHTPSSVDASNTGALNFYASRTWTGRSETVRTGITVNAKGNNNVTRTKQFGVYYYIAF